ncbi:MAG: nucleotidyltransferase family protein [Deltaproteobacteria bacterium]|nr:nucleotidyltransferase family protein [Deltaproteobacteria bacterium]
MTENYIKTAFILGAGLGTRLRPLTDSCPKPLLPVGGRPIITYAMDHLLPLGVERFIVNTHHLAPVYHQVFPEKQWRGIPIIFRYEPLLLDTAGGLKNIEDLLEGDENLMVYNGDVISDLPLRRLVDTHQEAGKEVTLALRSSGGPPHVCLNKKNEVCDFRGKLGGQGKNYLFTGIYAVKKKFLGRLHPGRRESVITVFLDMISKMPGSVAGVIIDEGAWYDAGSLEEYEKLNKLLPATREIAR